MISTEAAEKALEFLRKTARDYEDVVYRALESERKAKLQIALAIVRMENANTPTKVPATVRKEHALSELEVQEALEEADKAAAHRIGLDAQRDAAKNTLMLHMSMVKDRI